ncbi:MAG TPA: LysR family transcriptional regulator [Pseudolabrys sp.]|nr:LysR family transcriptional regulator [Pseudolabrys sp.]
MKIRHVTYFLALCEEKSFTRAARRCGVAQPSLTRAIQLLEQDIGGRLFERSCSNIRLTELGALVQPDFVRINQATESIESTAANFLETNADTSKQKPAHPSAQTGSFRLQSAINGHSGPTQKTEDFF